MYWNEFLTKETCKGCISEMLFFKKHVRYVEYLCLKRYGFWQLMEKRLLVKFSEPLGYFFL